MPSTRTQVTQDIGEGKWLFDQFHDMPSRVVFKFLLCFNNPDEHLHSLSLPDNYRDKKEHEKSDLRMNELDITKATS